MTTPKKTAQKTPTKKRALKPKPKPKLAPETDEIIVETPLPGLEIPEYHGRPAVGMKTSLTGAGKRINGPHEIGDRVILVIEARLKKAGHEETEDGLVYAETLTVRDQFEVQGPAGPRLLSAMRIAYRSASDKASGRTPLANLTDEHGDVDLGIVDGSGVRLTRAELSELRGDPLRAMFDARVAPVVVVYADGARELWPDEFLPETPKPVAGEMFVTGQGDEVHVAKILDSVTGESLDEWTDEQESDRLQTLEEKLAAEEKGDK